MKKYDVIGLMSGTSLDGLDIAYVRFVDDISWSFDIIQCHSVSYGPDWFTKLQQAQGLSALELKKLDIEYGNWIAHQVKLFLESHNFSPDLVVSHGHTIFHQPEIGITLQIGDGYQIMTNTGIDTVCDLRSLDVALGGQGAPLVPIGDKLLFSEYELCLNLGGFSNISFDLGGDRIAFDICPVNTVLNELASKIDLPFDKDGSIARSGRINEQILNALNSLNFYTQSPPKSLGMEWVQEHILPILHGDTPENLLQTYCHHIAQQIAASTATSFISKNSDNRKMLVTGGGAKNDYLIELLRYYTSGKISIIIPEVQLVDFKEAIVFGFLGVLKMLGRSNTLKSVTGARTDSCAGLIYSVSSLNADQ